MAGKKSFEELVLEARDQDRQRIGKALAADKGPAPYSSPRSEQDQDALWEHMDEQYRDDAAFLLLMAPPEQGGGGLTPLAASYRRYSHRQMLVEGAGASIDEQISYADMRRKRMLGRQTSVPPTPDGDMGEQAQPMAPEGSY